MGFKKQHHFVLVHGAGHGAWCWVKVKTVLEKAGHRVTTIDLASAGVNTDSPDDVTSLEIYNQPLTDLFTSFPDDEKVILVGHSLGGMNLTLTSERFPYKIAVAVYLTALMPGAGMDLQALSEADPDFLPPTEGVSGQNLLYYKVEGGPPTSMAFPLDRLKVAFYNNCSAEDFAFAVDHVKKLPMLPSMFEPKPTVTAENYGSVPRVFVIASQDLVITPSTSRTMIALNPPNEVHEIDTDHSLFFSAVEEVEKLLVNTAAKYDSH